MHSGSSLNPGGQMKHLRWLQLACWSLFYVFLLLYTLQKWERFAFSFWAATLATASYAVAVYVHALWLIPRYFSRHKMRYFALAALVLAGLVTVRMAAENILLMPLHRNFYNWQLPHFSFVFLTCFLAFLFGGLLRIAVSFVALRRQQQELHTRHLATELNLLKAQVQPHFLFNTLNNIYYLACTGNPRTAGVVARLSDIMRYFVDEAPKERVPLHTEIRFLTSYMELEQIRLVHPVQLDLELAVENDQLMIPPMLFIPLVENIFKHGVDKTRPENPVRLHLRQENGNLCLETANGTGLPPERTSGLGLANLERRLRLLYGTAYTFSTQAGPEGFRACLNIPLYDHLPAD
ncbi:MAG TPA: histidine kinase [Chitinophagaceae bacterium]|jgi:uncharacterized integral membrane protein|nr:histidine kinase [Chitinophagaceae bacterium]